ncbi:hypothetical protein [Cyanobacterium aponinum]|uniref:O-linked N-acetylglucosamine transferase, SPINDLY family protein n=1 Tax=Cyanobacterium aponinum TaxID=379064 RepID=UPI000C12DA9F|nr:hypothetical protein [Cyanobacterium aponinum]PHV62815.1 hypothetical protein CSQ80_08870 [Cyanobacterium aponinum IPPAS B-1201]
MNNTTVSALRYLRDKNYKKAIEAYESLLEKDSTSINNYFYLGIAYLLDGDYDSCHSTWMSILLEGEDFEVKLDKLLEILDEQGKLLLKTGSLESVGILYQSLEDLLSNKNEYTLQDGEYYYNIALTHYFKGEILKAEQCFQKAIDIAEIKEAYNYLGKMYFDAGIIQQAIKIYKQQIDKYPNSIGGYVNLMAAFHKSGDLDNAINTATIAEQNCPQDRLLWQIRSKLILPLLYESVKEIEDYRLRFKEGLKDIAKQVESLDLDNPDIRAKALATIRNNVNFELAYQRFNHKEYQQQYGQLIYKIVSANYPHWVKPKVAKKKSLSEKIKVGFVSNSMCKHVVSRLAQGNFLALNRELFIIYTYYIGSSYDEVTQQYERNSHFFYHIDGLEAVSKQIIQDDLDILVFLEIGMSSNMAIMGSMRLAPVQCNTWCHPETSGLVNMDYFLSSDLMEPENAQEHYSEKLIRLPNLGICYPKPSLPKISRTREFFSIPKDKVIYFCGQSIFKYLPQHDYLLATIAQRVPNSKFVFLARPNPELALKFKQRLARAFQELDLDLEKYSIFIPMLTKEDFICLEMVSDVFLDSLGWSGGNTTLEAIACNLPVVTCPGEFMRGRHSYAILKMLGVTETIANSEDEYIDIAVRLGLDQTWRKEIKEKIEANHHNLYDDLECVRELERFFIDVCASNS